MNLDAVAATYRLKREDQVSQDLLNVDRADDESVIVWRPTWLPVFALGPADSAAGLCPDTATGRLGQWSRYNDAPCEERDTLSPIGKRPSTCSMPQPWATQDKPGLAGGALVWLSSVGPVQEDRWRPWTGTTQEGGRSLWDQPPSAFTW